MAPSLASIDSIFRFLFTIGFSFQPRAFPPSLELTLERVISSRFVKLIPLIQQVYQRSWINNLSVYPGYCVFGSTHLDCSYIRAAMVDFWQVRTPVVTTLPARHRWRRCFLFLKIQPRTKHWLPCIPWQPCISLRIFQFLFLLKTYS
jgi:hypothetical protein